MDTNHVEARSAHQEDSLGQKCVDIRLHAKIPVLRRRSLVTHAVTATAILVYMNYVRLLSKHYCVPNLYS